MKKLKNKKEITDYIIKYKTIYFISYARNDDIIRNMIKRFSKIQKYSETQFEAWWLENKEYTWKNENIYFIMLLNKFFTIWYDPKKILWYRDKELLEIYCKEYSHIWKSDYVLQKLNDLNNETNVTTIPLYVNVNVSPINKIKVDIKV